MYQLEGANDKNTRHGEVTRAFQAMLSGKYGTCASILQGLLEKPVSNGGVVGPNGDWFLTTLREFCEAELSKNGKV
jgi:hypothetical protein